MFAAELFRRHVGGRAVANLGALQLLGDGGQSEIGDPQLAPGVDHNIGRFDVAVQDALGMRGSKAGAKFAGEFDSLVRGQPPNAAQQAPKILAIDVLHGQIRLPVHFPDVVNAADILVRDLARDPDFIVEAGEQIQIVFSRQGQKLQRHRLAEDEIVGAIDLAHAALAQLRYDAVPAGHQRARCEAFFGAG